MLQGVKTEIGKVRRFGVAEDTAHTALVMEMIIGEGESLTHFVVSVGSSEWAQASRSVSTELLITACPLCSMRKASSRVTWPMGCAATPYCLAVSRTRASEEGLTDTIARPPLAANAAASAGPVSSNLTCAPRRALSPMADAATVAQGAKQDSARVTARPPWEISCADWMAPSAPRATRQSIRRFSAVSSMAGGSPATIPAMVLEYSEEENSQATRGDGLPRWGTACCPPTEEFDPSNRTTASPGSRKAIFRTCEASSITPTTPMTGVG